ncbi:rubrerythrin-like domain-containing protein [Halorubrum gandharaense]
MKDVYQNPSDESPYECFECGNIAVAENNPGACPDCASDMRNRRTPIE